MPITKSLFIFTALLLTAIGCGEAENTVAIDENPNAISVSGFVNYESNALEGVEIRVVAEFGTEYREFVGTTNKKGEFKVELPEIGIYTVVASHYTEYGVMSGVSEKIELGTNQRLDDIELQFFELPPQEDGPFSSLKQGLGWGRGCLAIGCEIRYGDEFKFLCCGYSVCISGIELCIHYGRH